MIRFVLHVGTVYSPNDGDRHKINGPTLAQLYGVRLSECIVIDEDRPETALGIGDLSRYLHLYPSTQGAAYWKISQTEHDLYPLAKQPSFENVIIGDQKLKLVDWTRRKIAELFGRS